MPLRLTKTNVRAIFPKAPQAVVDAFVNKQHILDQAGITKTRRRLAWFFANIEHECGGFTIPNLTENINYTHQRIAEVWPNRFSSAGQVAARFGSEPGWQRKAFNEIYGNRMGNRPGTGDGSLFIGRGGPQWTGRDGYEALARYLSQLIPGIGRLTAEQAVSYATKHEYQPEVCAAFWMWKNLNKLADAGNWTGLVKAWNGGTNGMADRNAKLKGNDPFIQRMQEADRITDSVEKMPKAPDLPPDVEPTPPTEEKPGWFGTIWRKIGAIFGGTGIFGGLAALTDLQIAVATFVFILVLLGIGIGFFFWIYDAEDVRDWLKRKTGFGRGE
jgi:predicted chitinase